MAYDDRQTLVLSFGEIDFGAGGDTTAFKLPSGKQGYLRDVIVSATETFTNDTTEAYVQIGTSADADAYANVGLGTLADTDAYSAEQQSPGDLIARDLPADTQIEVDFVAPTGGTPAGIGFVHVVVETYF